MKKIIRVLALVLVVALCATALASCAPNADPDKAVASLKKNEYVAAKDGKVIPAALTLIGVKGVDCAVSGSKTVETKDGDKKIETVTIIYFTGASEAKDAFASVKDYLEKNAKDKDNSDWTVAQSGKMIYAGTKAGIKAAK